MSRFIAIRSCGKRIRREKEIRFEAIQVAKEGTPIPIGITASLVNIANQEYVLSVVTSLGVVMFPTENDGVISLLRKTDSAMYEAK